MCKKIVNVLMVLIAVSAANASLVYDHFDGDSLNSAWVTSFANTSDTGWTRAITGSKLATTALSPTVANVKWTDIQLGQVFDPVASGLHIDFVHAWSQTEVVDMPYMFMSLKSAGTLLATIGYEDKTTTGYGTAHVYTASGSKLVDGPASQAATADWDIDQVNGQFIIALNGQNFLTVAESRIVDAIEIHIQGRNLNGAWTWQNSSPEMSIDFVQVVPEPASLLVLALGGMFFRRK